MSAGAETVERGLAFIGPALIDPLRPEAEAAVRECRSRPASRR